MELKSGELFGLWLLMLLVSVHPVVATTSDGVTLSKEAKDKPLRFHDPKYSIKFYPADAPYLPEQDQEVVTMTKGDGQKFLCALPKPQAQQKIEAAQNGTVYDAPAEQKKTRKTPEDLLDFLKDQVCILKTEGWWYYEFCYKKHFRQFHLEKDKAKGKHYISQEFSLGTYDADATAALHKISSEGFTQPDPRSEDAAQRYHAHIFSNGTVCDLTNQHRETEVRFVCAEDQLVSILSFKEAPTCKYTIVINVPRLCEHPLFHQERQPWLEINCSAIASSDADSTPEDGVEGFERVNTLVPVSSFSSADE